MGKRKDDQAFPLTWPGSGNFEAGVTIREYFAARAPARPARWFEPNMPPAPEKSLTASEYEEKDFEWRRLREIQKTVQWPWAWAELVLAAGYVEL